MSRRNLGNSHHSKFWDNYEPAVYLKRSVSVVPGIHQGGHTKNSQRGQFIQICIGKPHTQIFARYYMLVPSSDWQPMISQMQLKPLCTRILQSTIRDPDKFQNGLTKIFFRAGMLAALETLRSDRLNALVTVIQKNMRRRVAAKRYQKLRASTIKIQTWWRGILANRLVQHIRREVSAQRLQRGVRRYIQRHRFLAARQSILLVQSRKCSLILLHP